MASDRQTWNQLAADWLREHPGWHESREVAEGIGYQSPDHITGILHCAPGVEWKWRGALVQMIWRFRDEKQPSDRPN